MQVGSDVLAVLDRATLDGCRLILAGQIERPLYQRTAKVIEAAGGRWDRRAGAHLFEGDAVDAIEPVLLTGQVTNARQELGAFFTPPEIARTVIAAACIEPDMLVLEPSAGLGALALEARNAHGVVVCVEIDRARCKILSGHVGDRGLFSVECTDFLARQPATRFDRIVMNPPFARQADIDHVLHAAAFLREDGRLVAIMSASVIFRQNAKSVGFRDFVASRNGRITPLPPGSFRASGTDVNTCIVAFNGEAQP